MKVQEFIDGIADGRVSAIEIPVFCNDNNFADMDIAELCDTLYVECLAANNNESANRLGYAYDYICKRYGMNNKFELLDRHNHSIEPQQVEQPKPKEQQPEPQQEQANSQQAGTQQAAAPEDSQEPQQILTLNNTTKEKMVFGRALEKEYMELINGCYKWKKSCRLLAYMCGKLYCGDRVKVDESDYSEELLKGKSQLPRNGLQQLFNVNVGNNRDQMKKPPKQYHLIDNLFMR